MKRTPTASPDLERQERIARLRARLALESQAIAEGRSDIVYDEPLTAAERRELGLDRRCFDADGAEAEVAESMHRP